MTKNILLITALVSGVLNAKVSAEVVSIEETLSETWPENPEAGTTEDSPVILSPEQAFEEISK